MPEFFTLKRPSSEDAGETLTWVDLDGREDDSAAWLASQSGLSEQVVARLLQSSTLNLHESIDGGLLLRFHTRNVSPAAGDSESISVRFWIENGRVITICSDRVPALETLKSKASWGGQPGGLGQR